ncbi:hypothetical protein Golob_004272, partial [Gossypium lobatum]|nr:hypothetical protein [Gossypium lobatum]
METEFAGLSLDEEEEEILQAQGDTESVSEEEVLTLVGCFLTASIIHYPAMKSTMANLWHPVKGHNESFYEAKIEAGVEVDEMGWDLSLRAQLRRAQAMSSVWLKEERGSAGRTNRGDKFRGSSEWGKEIKFESTHDPILGFNLEGNGFSPCLGKARNLIDNNQMAMEHDMENEVVIGEEGKNKARGNIEGSDETGGRNRRKAEINLMLSVATKRQ